MPDWARAFAEEVGKTCIVVNRDVAGFVTTRLIAALVVEAVKLVESGVVSAESISLPELAAYAKSSRRGRRRSASISIP